MHEAKRRFAWLLVPLVAVTGLLALHQEAVAAVGSLPAISGTTPSGSPVYTIPIEATPGIRGMTPRLAIAYGGPDTRSTLGVGFDIAGLSMITACRKTIAQDGTAGPVLLGASDRYCLDGARLRLVSGTYGASGAIYRTEVDQLARIRSLDSVNGRPGWFQVESSDGLIYEYGRTTNAAFKTSTSPSAPIVYWAVNKISDRSGNSIVFDYENDPTTSKFRADYIRYTDGTYAGTGHYVVDFIYQGSDRPDTDDDELPSLNGDARRIETRLLDRIELKNDGVVYRQYRFTFGTGAGTNSRLVSIQECAATPSDCFPATTLTWQNSTAGHASLTNTAATVPNNNVLPLDYNGDGYEDLVWSNGSTWWRMAGGAGGYGSPVNTGIASTNPAKARVLDWNADGRMDLLVDWSDGKFRVLQGTATGLASPVAAGPGGIPSNTASNVFWIVDMNGDGRDDLLRARNTGELRFWIRVNGASGFGAESVVLEEFYLKNVSSDPFDSALTRGRNAVRRIDFNGDGLEDLLIKACEWDPELGCISSGWYQVLSSGTAYGVGSSITATLTARPALGDFNGDRHTDAAFPCGAAVWCFALAAGNGLMRTFTGPPRSGYSSYLYLAADYDGDGYDDLYVYRLTGDQWDIVRSTGVGPASSVIASGLSASGGAWTVTDWNGDGLSDLARYDLSTFVWGTLKHQGTPGERLATATDGFGNSVTFNYLPMSDTTVYTRGTGATYPMQDHQSAASLVRTLQMSPAGGTSYTLTYSYATARRDLQGRGFLGMSSRTVIDGRNASSTVETYRQDFPYIGAPNTVTIKQPSGTTITSTSNTYSMHTLNATQYNQRYLPYLSRAVRTSYEVAGVKNGLPITEVTETRTVNTLGNPTSISIATVDQDTGSSEYGFTYTTAVSATYSEDQTNWCLTLPTSRSETRTLPGGASETRSASWTVSGLNCRVTQQVLEPSQGSSVSLVTDVGYDDCGNVNSVSSYPAGQSTLARTTSFNYGTRCQLPETETNPLNQSTARVFNYALGVPTTESDANGLSTTYQYDTFGRLTRQQAPDGTATRIARTACDGSNGYCGKGSTVRSKLTRTARDTTDVVLRTDEEFLDGMGRLRFSHRDTLESGASIVEFQYDALDRLTQRTRPRLSTGATYWTAYTYDLLGRVTQENAPVSVAQPSGRVTTYTYEGRDTRVTDPRAYTTTRTANVLGQQNKVVDPSPGGTTYFAYTPFGAPASITDAAGNVTSWSYNVRGFVTGTSDSDAGTWSYTPNAFGELASQTDAKNQTTNYTYDKLSRALTRAEAEGTTTWTWGTSAAAKNIGRLASITSPGGYSETYTYDSLGRPSQQQVVADGTTYTINSTYAATTGQLATLQYPTSTSGYRLKLSYDYQSGLLKRVRDFNGSTVFWEAVSTDAWGHVQNETFGNGVATYTEYDQASGWLFQRQSGMGGGTGLIDAAVQWDVNGNLVTRQDLNQSLTESTTYDALNRFDYSQRNGVTNLDVALSANGNLNSKSGVGSYTYHATKRRAVIAAGSHSYGYDANGNMTSRDGSTISYTSYNLPSLINAGANSSALAYGAFRNRYKQVAITGGVTETTVYVAGLLEKVTKGGVTEYRHLIGATPGTVALHTRRTSGTLVDTYYLHRDHLGSPELITNAAGAPVVKLAFGAYGERRDTDWEGPVSAADLATIGNLTRHGFTGHEHLDSVGLIHMNGRVYDPVVGRFLSRDPLIDDVASSQGANGYAYVHNNPLSYVDPSGFDTKVLYIDGAPGTGIETVVVEARRLVDRLSEMFLDLGLRDASRIFNGRTPEIGEGADGGDDDGKGENDGEEERSEEEQTQTNALCEAGNSVAEWASALGNLSGKLELAGLTLAGVGFVTAQPEVTVPGLALAATGGTGNVGAAVLQFGAGLLQGAGGGGFSNSRYAALSLGTGLTLARGITGPRVSGYRTVSQRAGDAFRDGTATVAGGVNGIWTNLVDAAAPRQVSCPGGN